MIVHPRVKKSDIRLVKKICKKFYKLYFWYPQKLKFDTLLFGVIDTIDWSCEEGFSLTKDEVEDVVAEEYCKFIEGSSVEPEYGYC